MPPVLRILDANFNRAREALRVMEDAARFALNDATLSTQLKNMRHELREIVDALAPPGTLEANRDTPGDVGTSIATRSEMQRRDLLDVVIAAGKRLSESLRVIEEISKVTDQTSNGEPIAARLESLRYRAYEIDKQLQLRFGSGRARQWQVCLVLTRSLCKRAWREVLQESIAAGVDCVQVREKDMQGKELIEHVREVISIAQPRAAVVVNDRADIALASGADGVHLGQNDLSVADVRRIAGRSLIVGVSVHNLNEAQLAAEAGADYCGVGTMFATAIKPGLAVTGPKFLQSFIETYPHMPHVAIGGITPANVHALIEVCVRGVAMSSAICAASDPGQIVGRVREMMAANSAATTAVASTRMCSEHGAAC